MQFLDDALDDLELPWRHIEPHVERVNQRRSELLPLRVVRKIQIGFLHDMMHHLTIRTIGRGGVAVAHHSV